MVDGELDNITIHVSYPQNMSSTTKAFLSNVFLGISQWYYGSNIS